jgi:chemotaxis protein methyltransferase CheR
MQFYCLTNFITVIVMNNPSQLEEFLKFIERTSGIVLNERNQQAVEKLIQTESQDKSIAELQEFLATTPFTHALWQQFIQALTIGETYFHRNKNQIEALRNTILPTIIEGRREKNFKQIRIWSAGCATGEEPYTLAMLLNELLPDIKQWSISLLATDINAAYLAFAQQGKYTSRSFRSETPPEITEKWFIEEGKHLRVKPEVRRLVTFAPLNLIDDEYPSFANNTSNVDLILCRNVTIYFDRDTTRSIVQRFYTALNNYGWLIVGHSEPNIETYRAFETYNIFDSIIYQKIDKPQPLATTKSESPQKARLSSEQLYQSLSAFIPQAPTPAKPTAVGKSTDLSGLEQAQLAANNQQWKDALKWLEVAEQADKLNPMVHYLRGVVYIQAEQPADALLALRQAVYCDANFALAHYLLGDVYQKDKQATNAKRHWRIARSILASLPTDKVLEHSDGLTVEMLQGLLDFRLLQ